MYMLSESDGEIIVTLLASGEAAFDFNVTVRAMDITAIGKAFKYVYIYDVNKSVQTCNNIHIPICII